MENKKFYVPVHGANEVKELKDLANQVAFYKQELVKEKIYSWAKEHMIERHASSSDFSRDQMIEDLFGSHEMLNLMKVGITYADLLLATDELWAELEEARAAYRLKLAAEKVEPGEPLKLQEVAE